MRDAHPMMPRADHDEYAEQMFIRDFKMYVAEAIDPLQRQLAARLEGQRPASREAAQVDVDVEMLRGHLLEHEAYRWWLSFKRAGQELMWDCVGRCVDRQLSTLDQRARIDAPCGSLKLDPNFEPPDYVNALDIHLMPGGYAVDAAGSVRQGALMDRGGAVYLLGRNGGLMNDVRGHTLASHLFERYPGFQPQRTLDLGCGVGNSTAAVAGYFPKGVHHAVDVGASMLRYAHARAEHLGVPVHFLQRSADATGLPDESVDLVYSCILLHETSVQVLPRILAESYRVLRRGGVMIHLEVPMRYEDGGMWGRLQTDFETRYNNEPFWRGATGADYRSLLRETGLTDITVGYQTTTAHATREDRGFTPASKGVFGSWFVASARK